jgi:hypothetical protein
MPRRDFFVCLLQCLGFYRTSFGKRGPNGRHASHPFYRTSFCVDHFCLLCVSQKSARHVGMILVVSVLISPALGMILVASVLISSAFGMILVVSVLISVLPAPFGNRNPTPPPYDACTIRRMVNFPGQLYGHCCVYRLSGVVLCSFKASTADAALHSEFSGTVNPA